MGLVNLLLVLPRGVDTVLRHRVDRVDIWRNHLALYPLSNPRRGLGHNSANIERLTNHSLSKFSKHETVSKSVLADGRPTVISLPTIVCREIALDRPSATDSAC